MITQPDATGGFGSFSRDLLGTLTSGLQLVAAGELSKRYGFGFSADGQVAVDADGVVRSRSAEARDVTTGDRLGQFVSNPLVIVGVLALVGIVIAIRR
jgi:hypothetical protein